MFKDKFTWPPQYNDMVRRNFDKRGAAKFSQLMQDARKDLDRKQDWMGDSIWPQLKEHWASIEFKKKSDTNKRNRESMAGASLHTGGSIPHRQHWNKMREEYGRDPELVDFYFRTHRKKDQSWVGPHAESAYEKFEQRKAELSSQRSSSALGEDNGDASQQPIAMPSDIDIWVDVVGRKKGRVFGLGSIGRTLIP